jgi:hypothetical protein
MKCNLNNKIKSLYMSMITYWCESNVTDLVNYTNIYVILCLNTAEERVKVWPDELGKGFQEYVQLQLEHVVYDFMCTNVSVAPDAPAVPHQRRRRRWRRQRRRRSATDAMAPTPDAAWTNPSSAWRTGSSFA